MKYDLEKLKRMVNGETLRLTVDGYVCKILKVEDVPNIQCLKICYDIVEGDYANFYGGYENLDGFYQGQFYVCYKESAMIHFAKFIKAVQESNPGYEFEGAEKSLSGKLVGLIMREEEYVNKAGIKEQKVGVAQYVSIEDIRNNNYQLLPAKLLS